MNVTIAKNTEWFHRRPHPTTSVLKADVIIYTPQKKSTDGCQSISHNNHSRLHERIKYCLKFADSTNILQFSKMQTVFVDWTQDFLLVKKDRIITKQTMFANSLFRLN